ncbi:MAG: TPM domain-containing protein [Bacteroidales bacterium]|nr:TPM domain-containing protein [Bacteroidales bacterium]
MKIAKFFIVYLFLNITNFISAQTIPIPELKSPVTDLTETLSQIEIIQLENKLLNFEKDSSRQIAVLMLPTTGEESIEEYSIRLAEKWEIGSAENDDGIILLIAKNDRKLRIEVGYGLENKITDADAEYIIDNIITPEFKNGNFYNGIYNGIDAISESIKGNINIQETFVELKVKEKPEKETKDVSMLWYVTAIILMSLTAFMPYVFLKKGILFYLILMILIVGINLLLGFSSGLLLFGFIYSVFSVFPILIILIIKTAAYIWGKRTGNDPSGFFSRSSSSHPGSSGSWSSSSGSYSSGSYSSNSSSSSSYSGGGGSFGGGGATGSW